MIVRSCRVHALEAYAVSDREPALPYRIIRTPDTDEQASLLSPTAPGTEVVPPGANQPQTLQVISLEEDSAVESGTTSGQVQLSESNPSNPAMTQVSQADSSPEMPGQQPREAEADAVCRTAIESSLEGSPDSNKAVLLAASTSVPGAWPESVNAPVKTFVPAMSEDADSTPARSADEGADYGAALTSFMAQHGEQRPADAQPSLDASHGDTLICTPNLEPVVTFVRPAAEASSMTNANNHEASGPDFRSDMALAPESQHAGSQAGSSPPLSKQVQSAAHQTSGADKPGLPAARHDDGNAAGLPQPKDPVAAAALGSSMADAPGAAEMSHDLESGGNDVQSEHGRPAWTLLPPDPEGEQRESSAPTI